MNAFKRSWAITKFTFGTINKDREVLLFPLLASITSVIVFALFLVPFLAAGITTELVGTSGEVLYYVVLFLFYLVLAFISTFANVGVVYIALQRFAGHDPTFKQAFSFAMSRLQYIVAWSVVSAVVGVLLRVLENFARRAGGASLALMITRMIAGAAWGIATIFVIPVLAYENIGPFAAIRRSWDTFRQTWGETTIRVIGMGVVQAALGFAGFFIGIALIIASTMFGATLGIPQMVGFGIGAGLLVLYFVVLTLVFNVANTIFNAALYQYSVSGQAPEGFDADLFEQSVVRKK